MKKAICIMSGGMDSTLCAYIAKKENYELIALHFNYSQITEKKELKAFRKIKKIMSIKKSYEINIDFFKQINTSALTNKDIKINLEGLSKKVPKTYVPFRNGIFISIATALAEKERAKAIYIGVIEEDSSGYPDCKKEFINSINKSVNLGTKDKTKLKIKTPLINLNKKEIIQKSIKYNVPLKYTWTCYKNNNIACGLCDSCRLRIRGFNKAKIKDPINYDN